MSSDVITADQAGLYYRYGPPPDRQAKVILLHRHGCATIGHWGDGRGWVAWCPLPKRDKQIEEAISWCDEWAQYV